MPYRYLIKRSRRFFIYRVLHVDDTPHRIALGVAIGIFVAWTPTIGFQMVLTIALAWLVGANKLVGVPFVWVSNPLTVGVIYYPNYMVGRSLLGGDAPAPSFYRAMTLGGTWIDRINTWWVETWRVFTPLWLGSILMGLLAGGVTYFLVYRALVLYRRRWRCRHPKAAGAPTGLPPGSTPDLPEHLALGDEQAPPDKPTSAPEAGSGPGQHRPAESAP